MRPAEKPLVVHAPPDEDSDNSDRASRRGGRDWQPRGRSESPPISSRVGRKRMSLEKIALIHRNRDMNAIKSEFFNSMTPEQYARSREERLGELEQEVAEDIEVVNERTGNYLKRAFHRERGRVARGAEVEEIERLADEVTSSRLKTIALVQAGAVVNAVLPPPEPTAGQWRMAFDEDVPTGNNGQPLPHPRTLTPAEIAREFFQ